MGGAGSIGARECAVQKWFGIQNPEEGGGPEESVAKRSREV
jgi:hypothetical protein